MYKKFLKFSIFTAILALMACFSSCKTGEGCGLEEKYGAKVDKNGELSSKKGSSNLFSKKQRKRMGKG